jgi:hypothetical protein
MSIFASSIAVDDQFSTAKELRSDFIEFGLGDAVQCVEPLRTNELAKDTKGESVGPRIVRGLELAQKPVALFRVGVIVVILQQEVPKLQSESM